MKKNIPKGYFFLLSIILILCVSCGGGGGSEPATSDEEIVISYSVSGNVSGLVGSVVLQCNGSNDTTISENGLFSFSTAIANNETYSVNVLHNPVDQGCKVNNGSGIITDADVTNLDVLCVNLDPISRVNVDSLGNQGNDATWYSTTLSTNADGRFVAFSSHATNLVANDTNAEFDVFVHDRQTGMTKRISVDSSGVQANDYSAYPSISSDGRYIAFDSIATNLVTGDTNFVNDVFVHDSQTGMTTRVSVDSNGVQGNDYSGGSSISSDGRFVLFESRASNLVTGDTNSARDVFIHDRKTGQTSRVSVDSNGVQGNGNSGGASISSNGQFVSFSSSATNLVVGDTNGQQDVFVQDLQTGNNTLVSVDSVGVQGNGHSNNSSISSDGRYIAFTSYASNLAPGDITVERDVYIHDMQTGQTSLVAVDSSGNQADYISENPSISDDGRYIAFDSSSSLTVDDTNTFRDVYVHDRQTGQTTRVSVDSSGIEANLQSTNPSMSSDGLYVAFKSDATNLVSGDTNNRTDVFVAPNR